MNHEEQNSVLLALIRQIKSELKEDIAGLDRKVDSLQKEYDAVLKVQLEMLATQKATKRIIKWFVGTITFVVTVLQLAQVLLALI